MNSTCHSATIAHNERMAGQFRPADGEMKMSNAEKNAGFLNATDAKSRAAILNAIAGHYGISAEEALFEVTDADSEPEHLLDYLTGETRTAASVLMARHGFR